MYSGYQYTRIYRALEKLTFQRINSPINKYASELNRQISKEVQLTNKYMKKCSTLLSIKEMQIKTTLRFYLIPVRITFMKNTNNDQCWGGCRGKESLYTVSGNIY
jgi:hypothetical protein